MAAPLDAIGVASDALGALSLLLAAGAVYAARVHWIAQAVLPRVPGPAARPASPPATPFATSDEAGCLRCGSTVRRVRAWPVWGRVSFSILLAGLTAVSAAAMGGLGFSLTHVGPITRNLAGLATSWVFGVATAFVGVHVVAARWRFIASTTQAVFGRPPRGGPLTMAAALADIQYAAAWLLLSMLAAVLCFRFTAVVGVYVGLISAAAYALVVEVRLAVHACRILRTNSRLLREMQRSEAKARHGHLHLAAALDTLPASPPVSQGSTAGGMADGPDAALAWSHGVLVHAEVAVVRAGDASERGQPAGDDVVEPALPDIAEEGVPASGASVPVPHRSERGAPSTRSRSGTLGSPAVFAAPGDRRMQHSTIVVSSASPPAGSARQPPSTTVLSGSERKPAAVHVRRYDVMSNPATSAHTPSPRHSSPTHRLAPAIPPSSDALVWLAVGLQPPPNEGRHVQVRGSNGVVLPEVSHAPALRDGASLGMIDLPGWIVNGADEADEAGEPGGSIALVQHDDGGGQTPPGRAGVHRVTVRGQTGDEPRLLMMARKKGVPGSTAATPLSPAPTVTSRDARGALPQPVDAPQEPVTRTVPTALEAQGTAATGGSDHAYPVTVTADGGPGSLDGVADGGSVAVSARASPRHPLYVSPQPIALPTPLWRSSSSGSGRMAWGPRAQHLLHAAATPRRAYIPPTGVRPLMPVPEEGEAIVSSAASDAGHAQAPIHSVSPDAATMAAAAVDTPAVFAPNSRGPLHPPHPRTVGASGGGYLPGRRTLQPHPLSDSAVLRTALEVELAHQLRWDGCGHGHLPVLAVTERVSAGAVGEAAGCSDERPSGSPHSPQGASACGPPSVEAQHVGLRSSDGVTGLAAAGDLSGRTLKTAARQRTLLGAGSAATADGSAASSPAVASFTSTTLAGTAATMAAAHSTSAPLSQHHLTERLHRSTASGSRLVTARSSARGTLLRGSSGVAAGALAARMDSSGPLDLGRWNSEVDAAMGPAAAEEVLRGLLAAAAAAGSDRRVEAAREQAQRDLARHRSIQELARAQIPKLQRHGRLLAATTVWIMIASVAVFACLALSLLSLEADDQARRGVSLGFRVAMFALHAALVAVAAPDRDRWRRSRLMVQVRHILAAQHARAAAIAAAAATARGQHGRAP